jgi:hypothetical protein
MQLASPDAQSSLVLFARFCVKWVPSLVSQRVKAAVVAVAVVAVVAAVGNVVARGTGLSAVALVSKSQAGLRFATMSASHGPHSVHDTRGAEYIPPNVSPWRRNTAGA